MHSSEISSPLELMPTQRSSRPPQACCWRLRCKGAACLTDAAGGYPGSMNGTILWIIAAVLVIAGIITLISGSVILGIVLIVLGLLVGPGGYSIFNSGRA